MAKYSEEFKIKLVTEYLDGNIGYGSLAKKYNMGSQTPIHQWVKAYESQGMVIKIVFDNLIKSGFWKDFQRLFIKPLSKSIQHLLTAFQASFKRCWLLTFFSSRSMEKSWLQKSNPSLALQRGIGMKPVMLSLNLRLACTNI